MLATITRLLGKHVKTSVLLLMMQNMLFWPHMPLVYGNQTSTLVANLKPEALPHS